MLSSILTSAFRRSISLKCTALMINRSLQARRRGYDKAVNGIDRENAIGCTLLRARMQRFPPGRPAQGGLAGTP